MLETDQAIISFTAKGNGWGGKRLGAEGKPGGLSLKKLPGRIEAMEARMPALEDAGRSATEEPPEGVEVK